MVGFDDILVCIVLYKQSLADSNTFKTLLTAVKGSKLTILAYDNSPAVSNTFKQPANASFVDIVYYKAVKNNGVAGAYNYGAKMSGQLQKKYLFFFDQDTYINSSYFTEMFTSINNNPNIHLFCPLVNSNNIIISPAKYYLSRAVSVKDLKPGVTACKYYTIVNSGIAVSLSEFQKLGGYTDKLFMDFSDHYFFNKYKSVNTSFVIVNVQNNHELSSYYDKDYEKVLARFKMYCSSAKVFAELTKKPIVIFWAAIRGIRLFFVYKKRSFLVSTLRLFKK